LVKVVGKNLEYDFKGVIVGNKSNTLNQDCFSVSVTQEDCFSLRVDDNCIDFEDENYPLTPNEQPYDLPFYVYAIHYHFKLNRLYLVIKENAQSTDDEILDEFAKTNLELDNGKFGYLLPYKANEITKVYLNDTDETEVQYELKLTNEGKQYIEYDNYIQGLFNVKYKPTILTKIAEYDIDMPNNINRNPILSPTGKEFEIDKSLVDSGVLLMAHQESETNDPLLFRDKNGISWRVDLFDLSIHRLNFDMPSYMANRVYAYNDDATGAYNIQTNEGVETFFKQDTILDKVTRAKLKYFMQSVEDNSTLAFIEYIDPPIEYLHKGIVIMPYLMWEAFRVTREYHNWSGTGSTGAVSTIGYYTKTDFIEIEPQRPQITDPHFVGGLYYELGYMKEYQDKHYVLDKFGIQIPQVRNHHNNQKRITVNNIHFIAFDNSLYAIKNYYKGNYLSELNEFGIYNGILGKAFNLGSIEPTSDYTIHKDKYLLIANGDKNITIRDISIV